TFAGRLSAHNCNLQAAAAKIDEEAIELFYIEQGNSSAFSPIKREKQKANPYKKHFRKGADIIPRAFYFVDIYQEMPPDFEDRLINIRTSALIQPEAKKPWTGIDFKGRIESRFLFRTALSKSILPFALFEPGLVALPIIIRRTSAAQRLQGGQHYQASRSR